MRPRLLVFIVAHHVERTIDGVLSRIPASLSREYDTQVLVLDDASTDRTYERSRDASRAHALPFPVRVLSNAVRQGYGGNQKIGFHYAVTQGFDYIAMLDGDGRYAPECLGDLVRPVHEGTADACFGSRMLAPGAALLKGGMPFHKFIGNRALTWFQNRICRTNLSEWHSGYRVYSVRALARVPFALNTSRYHFDTEIVIQFTIARLRIVERPIPTYSGHEIRCLKGLAYVRDVCRAMVRAKAQELCLFYDPRFDCAPEGPGQERYPAKLDFESPHSFVVDAMPNGARVLDLGCGGGLVAAAIRRRGCYVAGVDTRRPDAAMLDEFHQHDLNRGLPDIAFADFDFILLLDVLEHLTEPERFIAELARLGDSRHGTKIVVSTGNVAFVVTRLMLLIGQFNYGKRGILDLTHTRLFTFSSMRRLFEQQGFLVLETRGVPAPFPMALGRTWLSRALMSLNRMLIRVSRRLFAYQMIMIIQPYPSLGRLLTSAEARPAAESLSA